MEKEIKTKFKVGDKVRIRKDLKEGKGFQIYVNKEMEKYAGTIATISKIICNDHYILKEVFCGDNFSDWHFTDDMLEPFTCIRDNLQFGDILTLRNGERYVYADGYMYGEDNHYDSDYDEIEDAYNENLMYDEDESRYRKYDIVKVERVGQVVYEREDIREMTVEEISEALGYEVKVVK